MRGSQVHTHSGHKETEEHLDTKWDWIRFMGPMGPLNGWLNITCHVNIIVIRI